MKWQTSGLSDREQEEFISLVKHLLCEEEVLDKQEVMQVMVKPFLVIEGSRNLEKLILPLEILKVMCQDHTFIPQNTCTEVLQGIYNMLFQGHIKGRDLF